MSLNRDDRKSVEAIRARAQALAASEPYQGTGDAESLAALADGTLSFEDIPDATLERCIDELGADSVVDALIAAPGPQRQVRADPPAKGPARSGAHAIAAWWRRLFERHGRGAQTERPVIPAMALAVAVLAIGGAGLLTYECVVLYRAGSLAQGREREARRAVQTADNRAVRPPRVQQGAGAGKITPTPAPGPRQPADEGARAPVNSGPAARPTIPPGARTGGDATNTTGVAAVEKKVESEHVATTTVEKPEPAIQIATARPLPGSNVGGETATATSDRPFIGEQPHLGDDRSAGSRWAAAIRTKLESEYHLTRTTDDKSDIVTAGSVLVLNRDKLLMVAAASTANACLNTYRDGKISPSKACAFGEKMRRLPGFGHVPGGGSAPATRNFVSGEKFWVTKIDVRDTGIALDFFTDATPVGDRGIRYKGTLLIPFLGITPRPDQALKLVADVVAVVPLEDAAPAPTETLPPPPADRAVVSVGQTPQQVVAVLGPPTKKIALGAKEIYYFKDVRVTFVDGKATDVQ